MDFDLPRQKHLDLAILPASPSDIPTLARINVEASSMDLLFRLLYPDPAAFKKDVQENILWQLRNPNFESHFIKAISETGEIMGWAGFLVFPKNYKYKSSDRTSLWCIRHSGEKREEEDHAIFPTKPGLGEYLQGEISKWQKEWMEGRRHVQIDGLFTLPKFQRRGVGTALMKWVLDWVRIIIF
jgi:GNAT superfamily N-acetyltransferase